VPFAYAAPTAALAVNDGLLRVEMGPGPRVGAPGTLRLLSPEPRGPALVLENRVRTVGPERHGQGTVDFLPSWEEDRLVVRGEYPVNEPVYRMELADPRPERTAALALRQALADAGVTVVGGVRIERGGTAVGEELARWRSPPLGKWVPRVLEDSHNWTAEMLLRVLASEVGGEGRDTTGLELAEKFLVEVVGVPEDSFVLDDASGLSPYDLLTPSAVVRLLAWAWEQPWRAVFVEALAAPGEGTLGAWPGMPPVAAKTGTVRHSLALAGYLEPSSPRPVIFAVFLNHRPQERPGLRAEVARWLRGVGQKNP
jgi:D-alanyl-D-alanine carboxypeptidase/D-alanyl-D-alanine-endopeptidase (penicillin-binding protein 4)